MGSFLFLLVCFSLEFAVLFCVCISNLGRCFSTSLILPHKNKWEVQLVGELSLHWNLTQVTCERRWLGFLLRKFLNIASNFSKVFDWNFLPLLGPRLLTYTFLEKHLCYYDFSHTLMFYFLCFCIPGGNPFLMFNGVHFRFFHSVLC